MSVQPDHYLSLHAARVVFEHPILDDVTLSIHQGSRIGLVGKNGAGKSTLLRVIDGEQRLARGKRELYATVWYMPQVYLDEVHQDETIAEYLTHHLEEWWNVLLVLENRYGFEAPEGKKLSQLSGGQLVKLHAALAEVMHPEILLMDEPTNHLDLDAKAILADFVNQYDKTVIIASHDVMFLDQCVNTIWELDKGKISVYGGDYAFYRAQKRIEAESKARRYEVARKEKERIKKSVSLEEKRQVNNDIAAENYRHDRGISRMDRGYFKSKSQSRAGQKENMMTARRESNQEELDLYKPETPLYINYKLREDKSFAGVHLLDIRGGNLKRGKDTLITGLNFRWEYGDRTVILGANGVGKSSFVQACINPEGDESLILDGEIIRSQTARLEYMNQHYAMVSGRHNLIENMKRYNPEATMITIRNRLRDFLLTSDDMVFGPAEDLSGGEVARLAFAMITLNPLEGLILDEPTNNLDIDAIESIISALDTFPGGVITVSHNVDFLRRLNPTHTYVIRDGKMTQEYINYFADDIWDTLLKVIHGGE